MLKEKKIVITRDYESSVEFGKLIEEKGGIPVIFPTIRFVENFEMDSDFLGHIGDFDFLIFPSKNSVKFFLKKVSLNELSGLKVFAVGDKTKYVLEEMGVKVDGTPEKFTGKSLSKFILENYDISGKKILIPSSHIAKKENYRELEEKGAVVFFWSVYLNKKFYPPKKKIDEVLHSDYITFFSPSAVSNFFEMVNLKKLNRRIKFVSIGPTTSKKISSLGFKDFLEAKKHNSNGVIEIILNDIVVK